MDMYYEEEWNEVNSAMVTYGQQPIGVFQQVSTKVAPMYNGTTSWFAYEEMIDDWIDVTELETE